MFLRYEFESAGSRVAFHEDFDHYLQGGSTPTTMTSLYFDGTVADDVVSDLAEWIHAVAPWSASP